jgi:hypothetical protein
MELLRPGLIGLAWSATTAAVVLVASGLIGRLARGRPGGRWGPALALGTSYALGHAAIQGWIAAHERPPFPPLDAPDWLPWLALAAMGLGLLEVAWPGPAWSRWENRLLLTGGMLWLLLNSQFQARWATNAEGVRWLVGLGAGVLAFWGVLEALADRLGGALPLPLLIQAGGTAAVELLSGSLAQAEFAAVLAAALGLTWVASWFGPALSLSRGAVPVVAVALSGLILSGYFFAFVPAASALLLAAAPLALYVDRIGPIRRLSPWKASLVRALTILVPVAAAVAVAFAKAPPTSTMGEY